MDSGDGGNPQDIWGDENKFNCLKFMVGIIAIFTLVIGIILAGVCNFYFIYILPHYFNNPVLLIVIYIAILILIIIFWILPSCLLLRGDKNHRAELSLWCLLMIIMTMHAISYLVD